MLKFYAFLPYITEMEEEILHCGHLIIWHPKKKTPQNRYGKLDQRTQSCVPAVHFVKYLQQL